MKRRIVALMLSAAMALSLLPSSMAAAAEPEKSPAVYHSGEEVAEVLDSVKSEPVTLSAEEALGESIEEFTFGIEPNVALAQAMIENSDIEVDENDPTIKALREELEGMKVEQKTLNDDGTVTVDKVGLSDKDIEELVQIFSAYSAQWAMNADALGAQVPYYLGYNDNKDDLGIMGEMLIIAGWKLEDVRAGAYTKDDLAGLILNFYYGDYFGVSNQADLLGYGKKGGFYRDDIINNRNEVLKMLEEANCTTEAQKLLLINDWIGEHGSFNMPHVMNQGTSAKMLAPEPLQNEHYDEMFATINEFYKDSITAMLRENIHDGILGDLYNNTYDNVYWQLVEGFMGEETAAMYAKVYAEQAYEQAVATDTIPYPVTDEKGNPVIGEDGQPMLMDIPIDTVIDQSMDTPIPSFGNATPNQIIMGGAKDAATGLTDGVVGIWKSNLVGALSTGNVVCLGYSKAFQYLVQCMHPEVYTKNGQIDNPKDWKSNQELYYNDKGEVDPSKFNVDLVCIEFASDVSMYGIEQEEFNSDHYWNAVKVDGKWYYIDCCYIDVYSEVMIRDQVEADGSMNHLYFLISDTTMREMFENNYKTIRTLYKDLATDKSYETSWYTRIKNAVGHDGKYIYYLYDSTDMLGMMADYKSDDNNSMQDLMKKQQNVSYRLVRHAMDAKDIVPGQDSDGNATNGADSNFETLVYLNYKPQSNNNGWGNNNNNNQDPVAYYLGKGKTPSNTSINNYTKEESVTKAYADFEDMSNIYASASLAAAYNDGIIYFGVGNAIFAYDIANGTVKCVKQYGVVNMERDPHNEFQGRAYAVTDKNTGIATENAPIAGLQVLDGKLLVSLSSNYSYISGKDEMSDDKEGYTFQESAFNYNYNAFSSDKQEEQAAEYGYSMDRNDNDEFMFSAIAHDSLDFGKLKSAVTYKEIECDHEFFLYRQNYYSLDDAKNFYYGASWVCYKCGKNHRASYDDSNSSMMQTMGYGDTNEGITTEVKDHTIYEIVDKEWKDNVLTFSKLKVRSDITDSTLKSATGEWDYFNELDKIKEITLDKPVAVAATAAFKEGGSCTDGGTLVYTAEGYTSEGFHFEETKEVEVPANTHVFTTKEEENNNNGGFGNFGGNNQEKETSAWTWSNDRKTATIDASKLTCISCSHSPAELAKSDTFTMDGMLEGDKLDVKVGEPEAKANAINNGTLSKTTCTQSGSKFYYADGKVTVEVTAAKTEHTHAWEAEGTTTPATCTEDGSIVKKCTVEGCTVTNTEKIDKLGHDYGEFKEVKPATCTENGLKRRTCSRCNGNDDEEIPALKHIDENDDVKCDRCGEFLDHEDQPVVDAKVDATCTEAGKTEGSHCAICGEVLTAQEVIPAKGHTEVEIPAKAATCTTEGSTAGKKCSVCGNVSEQPQTVAVDPNAHDFSDNAENCKLCGELKPVAEISETAEASYTVKEGANTVELGIVVVDCVNDVEAVNGHSWRNPTWSYKTNEDENGLFDSVTEVTMKTACRNCDYVESHAGVFNPKKDVTVKAPTCTQNGSITYNIVAKQSSGKIDSGKYTEVSRSITINPTTADYQATGHSYDYVWTWADDLKTATLNQVCAVCNNKVKVATVNSTKTDNLDQIEKCETGAILYMATYKVDDETELKTSKTVWVPAEEDHPDFFVNREKDDDTGLTWDRTRCVVCHQCVNEDLVDFTLVFNPNGGKGEMDAQTVSYGVSTPITANAFTKTGYTFKGWTAYRESDKKWYGQNKDGKKAWVTEAKIADKTYTKVIYKDKAKVAATSSVNNDKIQMYAEWTANKYTIIFEPNGGTGTKMADMTITYGTAKNLKANTYKKTGYTFAGWGAYRESDKKYYGVDAEGNKKWVDQIEITSGWYDLCLYKDKASVAKSTAVNGDKVHLTAQWKANKYTVEFIGNGSTSGSMAKQTITYGVSQKLTANAFKKTGYTFTGWTAYRVSDEKWYAKDSKGNKKWATKSEISSGKWTKVAYADQASIAKSTSKNNDTIKMYAQWKANTYTVKFNANGGTGTMKDMTVTYGTAKALTANAFKKSGKTFKGWYSYRASDKKWYVKDADGNKKWATDEQIKSQNLTKVLTANKASVSKLTSVKGDTVTMYAQWK